MNTVEDLLQAVERLSPADRALLFQQLAARGLMAPAPTPPGRDMSPVEADFRLVFDGGSRGNPGPGYGSYRLTDTRTGEAEAQRLDLGENCTNNEAEYDTLIAALTNLVRRLEEAGRRPGEVSLEVQGDSALVLKQVSGEWKAREARMAARRDQVRALLAPFRAVWLTLHGRSESLRRLGH